MDVEPIWFQYATFDDDGYVNGIREDAPENAKEAYREEKEREQEYIKAGERIPR